MRVSKEKLQKLCDIWKNDIAIKEIYFDDEKNLEGVGRKILRLYNNNFNKIRPYNLEIGNYMYIFNVKTGLLYDIQKITKVKYGNCNYSVSIDCSDRKFNFLLDDDYTESDFTCQAGFIFMQYDLNTYLEWSKQYE